MVVKIRQTKEMNKFTFPYDGVKRSNIFLPIFIEMFFKIKFISAPFLSRAQGLSYVVGDFFVRVYKMHKCATISL